MSTHPESMRRAQTLQDLLQRHFPERRYTVLPGDTPDVVLVGYLWQEGATKRMEYVPVDPQRFLQYLDKTQGAGVIAMLHKKWERRHSRG